MKKVLKRETEHEVYALITNVAFANVPAWYGTVTRSLMMDIITPKNRAGHARLPLIVWICGGAYRCVSRSAWLPELMPLAKMGYVIASVEYRTVNDGTFREAYADVKTAIRFLKAHAEQYCIDPNRIVVMGESAGGTMASIAGTTGNKPLFLSGDYPDYDSSVNAVVDFYGVVDCLHTPVASDGRDLPPYMMQDFLGVDYDEATAWEASAIRYVDENTPPFLIFHGNQDVRVPVEQSERLYAALQAAGVRADYYVIDGAGHGEDCFYQKNIMEIIAAFLKEML